MSNYYILDDLPDDHDLPKVPTQLWLLLTLEVVISDPHGKSLLLTYPSYSLEGLEESGQMAEGYWTPPFLGYPVDLGFRAPDTVGAVKTRFQLYEGQIDKAKSISQLAYVMGLPNPDIVEIGSFLELKKSPRSPDLWKCYKIHRFSCMKLGPRGRRNLADPECRKGYVFLPLDDLNNVLRTRKSVKHDRVERIFLSKPLISNLDYVLQSTQRIEGLKAHAISLEAAHFRIGEEGLVFCADLAGYGTACRYADENMHSFTESGTAIATYFRESVACLFYRFLAGVGASQVHTAGDGFIAAIPKRHFIDEDTASTLREFMAAYQKMLCDVEQFNKAIKDPSKRVGSRLAIHYGNYSYGRIALSRSTSADFDGASIIEAARLEGALREYTKGPIQQSAMKNTVKKKKLDDTLSLSHTVICSRTLINTVGDMLQNFNSLSFRKELPIKIKEYESSAYIYQLDLSSEKSLRGAETTT